MTAARPGQFTGATDNAAAGGLFTDTLIDGIPDLVGADVLAAQTAATNAATSETNAETSASNAATSESNAATSATAAATSATNAATSATAAASSATDAAADVASIAGSVAAAATSATNAAASETAAAGSATSAATSATSATTQANTAVTSAAAASNSATAAATSATNSANSATASASSATSAATSATNASNSASAAATSATSAANAQTAAETAETNAETAETNAASSASAASSSAGAAASSETNAATSATNSANSATAASTSETNAAASATAAAASETAAAGYVDEFDDRYLGSKASDPTLDNDGNALTDGALYYNTTVDRMKVYDLSTTSWLFISPTAAEQTNIDTVANDITNVNTVATNLTDINAFANTYFISATAPSSPTEGDLWFDTSTDMMKVYNGSSWQAAGSSVNGTSQRYNYVVGTSSGSYTGSTTVFPATYDVGFVDVYLNGVKLVVSTDFTATNGTSIILATAASSGDSVNIIGYGTFSLANVDAVTLDGIDSTQFLRSDVADSKSAGDLSFADNVKAIFGAGSDLQIYSDGTNSRIEESGSGSFIIKGTQIIMQSAAGENLAYFTTDGAATLYHNNAAKIATTSTGIDVTGVIEFGDSHTIGDDGNDNLAINSSAGENIILGPAGGVVNLADDKKITFGTGQDLQIYHDGSNSYFTESGTGRIYITTNGPSVILGQTNGENMLIANADGAVDIYYNNLKKLATTATGVTITGTAVATTQTSSVSGSTTLDFGAYQNFVLTMTGNVTLDNPTTEQVGQSGFITFIQTGGYTVSLGTDYETAGGAGITLSASGTDVVPYIVAASGRILLGAPQLAFA